MVPKSNHITVMNEKVGLVSESHRPLVPRDSQSQITRVLWGKLNPTGLLIQVVNISLR